MTTQWAYLFLKSDPFDLTLPTDPRQVVWAGMIELKKRFGEIFEVAASSAATQIVLNRGPWGGGKTHASLYFGIEKNLPLTSESVERIYSERVHLPQEPGKASEDFYTDLLDTFGMSRVQKIVQDAVANKSRDEILDSLQKVVGSEELAHAFWLLGTENADEKQALLRAYFLEGSTRTELRKLGIARNISKSQDRFRVLAGVLQCLIGLDPNLSPSKHSRVCLWIDEMEDLIYFPSGQFRILTQGLRDMIDRLPNFFTLFLNISLAEPEEYDEIETILGRALIDRISDGIYFPELELEEGVQYVKALINDPKYRIPDTQLDELPQTYPFEEEALLMLLDDLKPRTPRSINKRCRNAINAAFRDALFAQPGVGIIDSKVVKAIEKRELDREIAERF